MDNLHEPMVSSKKKKLYVYKYAIQECFHKYHLKESCELIFSVAPSPVLLRNFSPSVICKSCHMLEQAIVSFFKTLVSVLFGTLRRNKL